MPRGPSTALMMSCSGRCQNARDQSTGGCCCARSNDLRLANQVGLRRARREHRPHLVLLAVQPIDEQHLHRAAAVPVPLLVVRPHPADAGAEALRNDRRQARRVRGGHRRLPFRRGRAADEPHLAVGPGARGDPLDGVVPVGERRTEDVVVAFGEEVPALVLLHVGVAALHGVEHGRHVRGHAVAHVPEVEVVRRTDEDRRHLAGGVLRVIDVGGEADAVAHRQHHLAVDHGERLELRLQRDPARLHRIGHRPAALGAGRTPRGGERQRREGKGAERSDHGCSQDGECAVRGAAAAHRYNGTRVPAVQTGARPLPRARCRHTLHA